MHPSSYKEMGKLVERYKLKEKKVLDVGSFDVNGTYRKLFENYKGYDVRKGPNVDIVGGNYEFGLGDAEYPFVISGQAIEHIPDNVKWFKEVYRICGEMTIVIAPSNGFEEHRYPLDCWRYFPDGMRWLFLTAGFKDVQCYLGEGRTDCIGIGFK